MSDDDFIMLLEFPANDSDWYIAYNLMLGVEQDQAASASSDPQIDPDELDVEKGFIYIIQCPKNFYKIGHAQNVMDRLKNLQTGCPYPLTLVHQIPCDNAILAEEVLHRRFKSKRIRGEWFKLPDGDVEMLKSLSRWRNRAFVRQQRPPSVDVHR